MTTEQEAEKLDRLIREAQDLGAEVEQLASKTGVQFVSLATTARWNRRMIWIVSIGGALLTLVTVVMVFLVVGVRSNTDRIDGVTQRLDATQTQQRRRALCPLYQIFLDSKSAAGRAAAPDPEKYDHAFDVIQKGYDVLDCASFHGNY